MSFVVELLFTTNGSLLCLYSSGMSHSVSTRMIGLLAKGGNEKVRSITFVDSVDLNLFRPIMKPHSRISPFTI